MGGPGSAATTERWLADRADLGQHPADGLPRLFIDGEPAAPARPTTATDQLGLSFMRSRNSSRWTAGAHTRARQRGCGWACWMRPDTGLPLAWSQKRLAAVMASGWRMAKAAGNDTDDHTEDRSAVVSALSLRPVGALSASRRTPCTLGAADAKLPNRARRIMASAIAADLAVAKRLLGAANGEVNTVIVSRLTGEPPAVAWVGLARCGRLFREALTSEGDNDETRHCCQAG